MIANALNLTRASVACAAVLVLSVGVAGCGGGESSSGADSFAPRYLPPDDAKRGGTLRVLASADVDSLDPGVASQQFSFMVSFATQRGLYASPQTESSELTPDLAESAPEVDQEAGTVKVKLREGVRFSPPVEREVRSADVKYALERSIMPGVANGFTETFFGDLVGFEAAKAKVGTQPRKVPEIRGIDADEPSSITFRFRNGVPALALNALTLPVTAPVPEEYAAEFDAKVPSDYSRHAVATGPYMVENDDSGKLTGHRPGKSIELVRNPNWEPDGDFRPAFLDEIVVEGGYSNTTAASRKIIAGESMLNGQFPPDPAVLRSAMKGRPDQVMMVPAGAILYASLNTTVEPLDDVNVRRAVLAAADRTGLRLARGGASLGPLATHFIPPGVPGFEEAGGFEGTGADFLENPGGDLELARSYMRQAGYPDGRYTGDEEISMVTDNTAVGRDTGEIVRQALVSLGIRVRATAVTQDAMYSRFCAVPRAEVAVCPNLGWIRQFNDAQTVLDPTFNGNAILPVNNSNWPQLNVPAINDAIEEAKMILDPREREAAWARIDREITSEAPAIPILWSRVGLISSSNVVNVVDRTIASPYLSMISLADPGD